MKSRAPTNTITELNKVSKKGWNISHRHEEKKMSEEPQAYKCLKSVVHLGLPQENC